MAELRYHFHPVLHCNMCDSGPSRHKILGKRLNCSQGKAPWKKSGITTTIMKCRDCSLIFSNPQPIPSDIQDHYGVPPEEYWQNSDIFLYKGAFEYVGSLLKQLATVSPGAQGLDIGAGRNRHELFREADLVFELS